MVFGAAVWTGCSSGGSSANPDSGTAGGGGYCGAPAFPDPRGDAVNLCISNFCCSQINACAADATCVSCKNNGSGADGACQTNAAYQQYLACGPGASTACISGGGTGGAQCLAQDSPCSVFGGQCCSGLICCDKTSAPTCQSQVVCGM